MSYYYDKNPKMEFKRDGNRMFVWVIHEDHYHHGLKPHVHILDLSGLTVGMVGDKDEIRMRRLVNEYMGMEHMAGVVKPWPFFGSYSGE